MFTFRSIIKKTIATVLLLSMVAPALAQDPVLYGVDGSSCTDSWLHEIDPADGSLIRTIGPTGVSGMTSMAFNPVTGVMYGITTGGGDEDDIDGGCDSNLYTINLATGVATLVGPTNVERGKPDAAFRADGTLFTFSTFVGDEDEGGSIYTVNLATGAMTLVGDTEVGPWDISLTFEGSTLVMTDGDTVYTVNTTTGLATEVATLGDVNDSNMSTTHPVTGQVYLGDRTRDEPGEPGEFLLFTLDTSNGDLVLLGTNDIAGMSAIEFVPDGVITINAIDTTPVPTLTSWSLMLLSGFLGLIAFAAMRRRAS